MSIPPSPPLLEYDLLIVTAANRAQARGYEAELRERAGAGQLGGCREWMVAPDPGDRRVGSGAATLSVLAALARSRGRGFFGTHRVLIVHSGGDSRRLPAYAAHGKVFLPLPIEDDAGWSLSMFDLILRDLRGVRLGEDSGAGRVVIASGDVYLALAGHGPEMAGGDVVGLAFPDVPERGARHGVYVAGPDGRVLDFLQKPAPRAARERGAIDRTGRLLVDTGVVSLSTRATGALLDGAARGRLLERVVRGSLPALDLYDHVLSALAPGQARADGANWAGALRGFRQALAGLSFKVCSMPSSAFVHIGTTRELLERGAELASTPPVGTGRGTAGGILTYNSGRAAAKASRGPCVVESCLGDSGGELRLRGRNVVVGLPSALRTAATLARGMGMVALPIGTKAWSIVAFSEADDFKTGVEAGGTLFGRPLAREARLTPADWVAGEGARSAWNARLWRVGGADESLATALAWLDPAGERPVGRLWSLAELMPRIAHGRLIAHRREGARLDRLSRVGARALAARWAWAVDIVADVRTRDEAARAMLELDRAARAARGLLDRARLVRIQQRLAERFPGASAAIARRPGDLAREPYALIGRAVAIGAPMRKKPPRPGILGDQVVWVTCPARIDLSGGWTDTPPICQEQGGLVVNAAVTTNGQYPVQVICRLADRAGGGIRLSSVDLGRSMLITRAEQLRDHADPTHWAALPKAALALAGLAPPGSNRSLKRWLGELGGLDVSVFSALPKGSGMGTSSILGAALLAALARVVGERLGPDALIRRTSVLEQVMNTGGGWQDQIGGIVPGVKVLETGAGPDQTPRLEVLAGGGVLGSAEAQRRVLLYYTGQRRMARNILRNVVGRYLDRDPAMRTILGGLKAGARDMREALVGGDLKGVGGALRRYWELKKAIDAGATNAGIESLLARVGPYLDGYGLAGAGGGGFVVMVARDPDAAAKVRSLLTRRPQGPTARFYDWAIDSKGLSVGVV